jgi:cAMP-binding proteins - catabolite gene activator and regulatory subunit of cAMP-dependent protein kinases
MPRLSKRQIATLRENDLFSTLGETDLSALVAVGHLVKKTRGDVLFACGDEPDGLYVVLKGEIGVYANDRRGNQLLLNVLRQGAVVGDIAVMDGKERTATVTAHTTAEMFFVPRNAFLEYLEALPKLCVHFAALLAARCRYVSANMEGMFFMDGAQRVAHALLGLVHDAVRNDDGLRLRDPVNQSALALRLGLTREYVNKAMRAFVRSGVIIYDAGYVTVCDVEHLKNVVDGVVKERIEVTAA